ncbi:hypothetical protein [Achromobacter mucicolens]|uniref:hypothetical protein n=1 Tax=Achromobacter mucicolens TaxID=1389922 RepID=UPI0022F3A0F7|nr:hypothetical protein [Achromobacter mucicolens]WBX88683.1 hypothetical protein PE062_25280 [Achromobacter mucicolens]
MRIEDFNPNVELPLGLTIQNICDAMNEFVDFIGFIGQQLATRDIPRLESMLMQANFSSMVGEFMGASIPKYCSNIVRNNYHNGHPDLIPANTYPNDSVQYAELGVEIKASRYLRGWQGHNAEESWLMVFCFDSSRPVDVVQGIPPKPFEFLMVAGAQLEKSDWTFSGRSETSRRTITASVNGSGYAKMTSNWIYKSPKLR